MPPEQTAAPAAPIAPIETPEDQTSPAVASSVQAPSATNVINPEGELVSIPSEHLSEALQSGYQQPTPEQIQEHSLQDQYGTTGQEVAAGAEAAAQGVLGPIAPALEHAAGVPNKDIRGRQEANPGIHTLGEIGGLTGSMFTGAGEGAIAEHLGEAGMKALGLSAVENPGVLARVGSAATKAAIENALIQGSDETTRMVIGDPSVSAQSAILETGLAGLIGGGVGGTLGAVSPLWKAAMGGKTAGLLKSIADRVGGVEGVDAATEAVNKALAATGLTEQVSPEIRAAMSNDPQIKELASVLSQSDTTKAGKAFQETAQNFRDQVSRMQTEALGGEYGNVGSKGELDRYTAGKNVGETLAGELNEKVEPLSKGYDEFYRRHKNIDLTPSISDRADDVAKLQQDTLSDLQRKTRALEKALKSGDPERAINAQAEVEQAQGAVKEAQAQAKVPGTVDQLADKIVDRAKSEGWLASPSSEIMTEVNRVIKELPNLKTLGDLSNYIKQVGENTSSKLPFGQQTPVSRAGGIIKSILRDSEGEILGRAVGSEEGVDALQRYEQLRKGYAQAAQVKDQVAASLGLKASTTGYAKALKQMAAADGETVLKRLLGKGDAAWLELAQKEFPKTAELIKQFHLDELLAKAKDGEGVSSAKLMTALDSMDPQLRKFAVPDEALTKVNAAHSLLEQLNDHTHNYSNTARTLDKLTGLIPGSAAGLATLLLGHNPAAALLVGGLTKSLGRDIPDAVRLSLLKFLGSNQPIESAGFKAMADFIHSAQRGESLLTRSVKNVFKAAREVLPEARMPSEKELDKLDKQIQNFKDDPKKMLDVGGQTAHYLPDHGTAMGMTTARVFNYLSQVKPNTSPKYPLSPERKLSSFEKADYNRALAIAQQPLVVMGKIQEGRLSSKDVIALKSMYPEMYSRMTQKITEQMADMKGKGHEMPYGTRMSLSLFLGQPLDASMSPGAIQLAQATPQAQQQQPGNGTEPKQGAKHSTKNLSKLPSQYQTAAQSAEQDKLKH